MENLLKTYFENLSANDLLTQIMAFIALLISLSSALFTQKSYLLEKKKSDDEKKNRDIFFENVKCSRSYWERMPSDDYFLLVEPMEKPAQKMENLSLKVSFYNNLGKSAILDEILFEIVLRKKYIHFPVLDKLKYDLSISARYHGNFEQNEIHAPYSILVINEIDGVIDSLEGALSLEYFQTIHWDNDKNQDITKSYYNSQHEFFVLPPSNQLYNWEFVFLIPIDALNKIAKYGYNIHSIRARFLFQHRTIDLERSNFSFELVQLNTPFIVAKQKQHYSIIKHPLWI